VVARLSPLPLPQLAAELPRGIGHPTYQATRRGLAALWHGDRRGKRPGERAGGLGSRFGRGPASWPAGPTGWVKPAHCRLTARGSVLCTVLLTSSCLGPGPPAKGQTVAAADALQAPRYAILDLVQPLHVIGFGRQDQSVVRGAQGAAPPAEVDEPVSFRAVGALHRRRWPAVAVGTMPVHRDPGQLAAVIAQLSEVASSAVGTDVRVGSGHGGSPSRPAAGVAGFSPQTYRYEVSLSNQNVTTPA
jgi:hypothetical protein